MTEIEKIGEENFIDFDPKAVSKVPHAAGIIELADITREVIYIDASPDINKKMFELCEKYNMPVRMKRFIPDDYRKYNYIIAEKLLNKAYVLQSTGKHWSNIYWAGQNIQNQKESVADIAKRGELRQIRNVGDKIEKMILEVIKGKS